MDYDYDYNAQSMCYIYIGNNVVGDSNIIVNDFTEKQTKKKEFIN